MSEPRASVTRTDPETDWLAQLSEVLEWANDRAWPLGAFGLVVSVLYLFQYIVAENVPLTLASTSVLTSLPAMLALVTMAVLVLTIFVMLPAIVLFTPIAAGAASLATLMQQRPEPELNWRTFVSCRWFAIPLISVIVLPAWLIASLTIWPDNAHPRWWSALPYFFATASALMSGVLWSRAARHLNSAPPSTSWDYRFIASASGVFQLLVIISSLPIAAEWTRSMSAPDDSWFVQGMKFAAFSLVITLAIPGLQLLLSHFLLEAHTHKRLVARACLLATFLVTFFGMFPATGGRLSKLAFELSGSGGRDCVVLFWAPDASPAIDALRNGSDKTSSIGVRLLFDADGSYIARVYTASNKSQVHFIPHAAVRAMGECEKPDAKKEIKAG